MADKKISALTSASTPLAGTEVVPIVQSGATVKATIANIVGAGTSLVWGTSGWFTSRTAPGSGVGVEVFSSGGNGQILAFNRTTVAYTSLIYDANYHQWNISGAPAAYIDASKNLTFAAGNLIQGTAAKGVNFTANTPAAGMTSQLLNWYEEGTWTPTLTPGTSGSITLNTSFDTAAYTRVGRLVTITGEIIVASVSLPVGATISLSLPIAIGVGVERSHQISGAISTGTFGTQTLSRYNGAANTSIIDITYNAASVTADFRVQFSISYFA